jgi:hypothetical protein
MDDVYLEETEDDFGETSVETPRSPEPLPPEGGATSTGGVVVVPNPPHSSEPPPAEGTTTAPA